MAAIIVSGTATAAGVAQFLPGEWNTPLSLAASLLVVVASTLDFVFDLPGGARLHRDLKSRLHSVLASLETCGDADLAGLRSQLQLIYAQQPPALRYAQALAYNMAVDAIYPRDAAKVHYEPLPHLPLNPLAWSMRVDRAWLAGRP